MGPVGRYTVVKKVADGGMAEIFLATQTGAEGFARQVILKRILPAFSADPHFRNMIVDEAHIAMSLHHGNIVQVLDLGQADGRYFLVLELVDGWDVATVLSRGAAAGLPFPPGLSLYVIGEVCRALAYAHRQTRNGKPLGIIHRDISPQNVLLGEQGEVKLTDFGIAKALGKRERTQTGVIKGKLDFMSPEQAAGAPLDTRADIFSVGTLLYLLVTGRRPFQADGQLESLIRIQNADYPPPEEVSPSLSPKIAAIIRKSMQKVPSQRYASADAMLHDVEEVLRGEHASVGQTELKLYLDELGRRDRVPPISRAPGMAMPEGTPELVTPPPRRPSAPTLAIAPPAANRSPTMALADTRLQGRAIDTPGALPTGAMAEDSTELVGRTSRSRRIALGFLVPMLLLATGAAALHFFAPLTARRLVDDARHRVLGTRTLPWEPAAKEPAAPLAAKSPVAGEPALERAAATTEKVAPEAEPASRSRATVVTVRLTSRPAGAVVRNFKGAVVGTTPLQMSLRSGTVQKLTFTKHGYATATRRVTVGDSSQAISVELSRLAARRARHRR